MDSLTRFSKAAKDFDIQTMGPWYSAGCLIIFKFLFSYSFERVKLLLMHLAKALCQAGDFSLPRGSLLTAIKFKTAAGILAVGQRLLRYNTWAADLWSCGRTTSPGYRTCRGTLCWRTVKAGEGSYWPGKLVFAGVLRLLRLAGKFSNLTDQGFQFQYNNDY